MTTTVKVNTKEKNYEIIIGKDILKNTGSFVKKVKQPCKTVIISDSNVAPIYAKTVIESLEKELFECSLFTFEAGEKSKNITVLTDILNFIAEKELTENDTVIALGGGVTGDLSGFAAAVYKRGIDCIQIPTTLLSCTDSSVGGKTAVNLQSGKNLAGAFHQPCLVITDIATLSTLPERDFNDGMAEVIKYGFINSPELLCELKKETLNLQKIIETSVKIKADIIEKDEHDKNIRKLLNFGHTIGHAVEKASDYKISHGQSVAIGMCVISNGIKKMNIGADITNELYFLLNKYSLSSVCPYSCKEIIGFSHHDKKRNGDSITVVIPVKYGKCELMTLKLNQLDEIITNGINYEC